MRVRGLVTCCATLLLGVSACISDDVVSISAPEDNNVVVVDDARLSSLSPARISFEIDGPLVPGRVINVRATVRALEDLARPTVEVRFPDLELHAALLKGTSLRRQGRVPVAAAAEWSGPLPRGSEHVLDVPFRVPAPGYYRAIASVRVGELKRRSDGAFVADVEHKEIWLLVQPEGGAVTEHFDPLRMPTGVEQRPGPFIAVPNAARSQPGSEGETGRWNSPRTPRPPNGVRHDYFGLNPPSIQWGPEELMVWVFYYDPDSSVFVGMDEVVVEYTAYDAYSENELGGMSAETGGGQVIFPCPASMNEYWLVSIAPFENAAVRILGGSGVAPIRIDRWNCDYQGRGLLVEVNRFRGGLYRRMRASAAHAQWYFGRSRSQVDVDMIISSQQMLLAAE